MDGVEGWQDNHAWDAAVERDPEVVVAGNKKDREPRSSTRGLYRPEQLLVDRAELRRADTGRRIREILESVDAVPSDDNAGGVARALNLQLFRVPRDVNLPGVVRRLNEVSSACAALNAVLIAGPQRHGGDSPPRAAAVPDDIPGDGSDGKGLTVAVLDTGITRRPPFPVTAGAADAEPLAELPAGRLGPAVGHGTFVAGIVSRHAPGADILARRLLEVPTGLVDELAVAQVVLGLVQGGAPRVDVLNCSFGGFAVDDRTMLALERAFDALPRQTLVVAAAGNHGVSRPFYPAAFKRVVAIGAAERQSGRRWTRAVYSNFGPWVDAYSTGTEIHSAFVRFTPSARDAPAFGGGAIWSGTSFAAPRVSAAAAALAARDGIPVRLAARQLMQTSTVTVSGQNRPLVR